MRFLFSLFVGLISIAANANTCPDLKLTGTWHTVGTNYLVRGPRKFEVTQSGCYLVLYDSYRRATWKIDLSGQQKIKVSPEIVDHHRDSRNPALAKNLENLEVSLTPTKVYPDLLIASLQTDAQFDRQGHFPLGLRTHLEAELSAWQLTNQQRIEIVLKEVKIIDVTEGLPAALDKPTFLKGVNTVFNLALKGLRYQSYLLALEKE